MSRERFPKKDADFNDFLVIAIPYLVANATRLGISAENVTTITGLETEWGTTYPQSQDENTATKSIIDDKIALRQSIESHLRMIYADIPESVLTTADRNTLHLSARDTTPTARANIQTAPQVTIQAKEGSKVLVSCRVSGDSNRPSRHKGSDGIEYNYTLAATEGQMLMELASCESFFVKEVASTEGKRRRVFFDGRVRTPMRTLARVGCSKPCSMVRK